MLLVLPLRYVDRIAPSTNLLFFCACMIRYRLRTRLALASCTHQMLQRSVYKVGGLDHRVVLLFLLAVFAPKEWRSRIYDEIYKWSLNVLETL